jgi:4-hydroxy-4-methyl-2-oxoglutarate aldolase
LTPDERAELLELGSATLGESGAGRMRARLAPAWPGATLAGVALPVVCTPGDNLAVHVAVARARAGEVLCVDVGDERELGYWGEVLTTAAETREVAGLVIDGCVRDVAALEAHGFPVFSTGIALTGATKTRAGSVGAPAAVGDLTVEAGDVVVGDRDGVVVIRRGTLGAVLDAARARAAREAELFDALRAGATTVELLGLDTAPIDGAADR